MKNAFEFHGVEFVREGLAICPWCGKDKFTVDLTTTKNRCYYCDGIGEPNASGNIYTFFHRLLDSGSVHPSADLSPLIEHRSIPEFAFRAFGVVPHPFLLNTYLFPIFNCDRRLTYLYKVVWTKHKWRLLGTPKWEATNPTHPISCRCPDEQTETIYLAEGHWDTLALYAALRKTKTSPKGLALNPTPDDPTSSSLEDRNVVVGIPGTSTLCLKDLTKIRLMAPKARFVICMDNDEAGQNAVVKLRVAFPDAHVLYWPTNTPPKYDLNDLFGSTSATKFLKTINENLVQEVPDDTTVPVSTNSSVMCTSVETLFEQMRQFLYVDETIENAVMVAAAAIVASKLGGEQLWMRIIGPPGSGKTTSVDMFMGNTYTYPISELRGLHSGYNIGGGDFSLIPKLHGKCVIVKDADVILSSPHKDRILGQFRDIYDGSSSNDYLNGVSRNYDNVRMGFILCGTAALRTLNRTHLGDRFLDFDTTNASRGRYNYMVTASIRSSIRALSDGMNPRSRSTQLRQYGTGFIEYLIAQAEQQKNTATLSDADEDFISKLAWWVTSIRSIREIDERDEEEVPTRVGPQLCKLYFCLRLICPDAVRIRRILQAVARATAYSLAESVILALRKSSRNLDELSTVTCKPPTTVRQVLYKLSRLGMVRREGRRHDHSDTWGLSDKTFEDSKVLFI